MKSSTVKHTCTAALGLAIVLFCGCRTAMKPVRRLPKPEATAEIPAASSGQIYLIIDDAGQRLSQTDRFLDLPVPLTIAVLPGLPATQTTADAIQRHTADKQLILHQPMQALNTNLDPGPGAIYGDTPLENIASILQQNFAQLPGAHGMNNHMGSLITQDPDRMHAIMAFCKENDLFFIDSFTTPDSIVGQTAREHGVPTAQQHIFLDNDHSADAILQQFKRGMRIAENKGFVVMIGHVWSPETARVIQQMTPSAQAEGFSFHTIDNVLRKPD